MATLEGIKPITVCDDCKGEFIVTPDDIKKDSLDAKGERIQLTYFTCPHCGKVYKVSIETMTTLQLKQTYLSYGEKLRKMSSKGKQVPDKQLTRLEKYKKALDREYARLDTIYSGSFYQK